jgi:hypothetical protein
MSLEWFERVIGELQDHLESICEEYDQTGEMSVERGAKHPRIEFYTEVDEDIERDYFCTLFFDPNNEEFYLETVDPELGHLSKVILPDIEDIIDAVHKSFHNYIGGDMEEVSYISDDDTEVIYSMDAGEENVIYFDNEMMEEDESQSLLEVVDVEWETPEVTAYYEENEVEVTYQFGVIQETGDGVLKRVNRIWTDDDHILKDENHFIFSKEEAGTIIALIASHLDSMSEMSEY